MSKTIERLLHGQFSYETGFLRFSEERLQLDLLPGEVSEGEFHIEGPQRGLVEGRVTSSEVRMQVITPDFSGAEDSVSYRFDASGLVNGDVLKGNFRILSNQGEYMLPFVVSIREAPMMSSLGEIRNLFHFANLAKTAWKEAVALFYSEHFARLFQGPDAQYESIYRGLQNHPGEERHVEEFLLAIHKKLPVEFIPDRKEIIYRRQDLIEDGQDSILIGRGGFGYCELFVSTDTSFLVPEKDHLTEEDFIGNSCRLPFRIDVSRLHEGLNLGAITFSNPYVKMVIRIRIEPPEKGTLLGVRLRKRQLTIRLMKLYESFRLKKRTSHSWMKEAEKLLEEMLALDEEDLSFLLYQAHFLITVDKVEEGKEILNRLKGRLTQGETEEEVYCYYLYLTTLAGRDDDQIREIAEQIEEIFHENPGNWRIAWLLQFVSEEFAFSNARKWELLKDQFARGCRSPILYVEALQIMMQHPSMLVRLDPFTIYMFRFCARNDFLTVEMADQAVFLASRAKTYDADLRAILEACYALRPQTDTLEALCRVLIAGEKTDSRAHEYYVQGVAKNLHLNGIFELYMMSLARNENGEITEEIPKSVLIFFSYQNALDDSRSAILYRYLYDHREQLPELYEQYLPRIRAFVVSAISKRRTGANLGVLYKAFLDESMVNAQNADAVLEVLYTAQVRVQNPNISEVVVLYEETAKEMHYPVREGRARVPLYGGSYAILLASPGGERFASGVSYAICKWMIPGRLSQLVGPFIRSGEGNLSLYLCNHSKNCDEITMENVSRFKELLEGKELRPSYKNRLYHRLLRFYYENGFHKQLSDCLLQLKPQNLSGRERGEYLEMWMAAGNWEKALSWLVSFGTYGIDPKTVLKLCTQMDDLGEEGRKKRQDPRLIETFFYAFQKGKYNSTLLQTLCACFCGTTREMRDVYNVALSMEVDVEELSERLLLQMLYTGAFVGEQTDIFRSYVQKKQGSDLELAFLAQASYDHFVKEKLPNAFLYQQMEQVARGGQKLPVICLIDYLKYASEHKGEMGAEDLIPVFLKKLMAAGLFFPFFMEFQDLLPKLARFSDRVMLVYRSAPGKNCTVHYLLNKDTEPQEDYESRPMKEMYDSVYIASFILFFGEQVQYYITEDRIGEAGERVEQLTQSGTLQRSDIRTSGKGSRFSMINDLMVAGTLSDYDTFDHLAEEYFRTGFISNYIFQLSMSKKGMRENESREAEEER